MKIIRLFKDKAVCPRCDGNGLIYYKYIEELNYGIYICDECEAMWEHWKNIFDKFQDLNTYLSKRGISSTVYQIIEEDYNWISIKFARGNSGYYMCPLFQIIIYEGDCYDINMVRADCVKREILQSFELEIGEKVDIGKANLVCDTCKYGL